MKNWGILFLIIGTLSSLAKADLVVINPGSLNFSEKETGRQLESDLENCTIAKTDNGYMLTVKDLGPSTTVLACGGLIDVSVEIQLNGFTFQTDKEVSDGNQLVPGPISNADFQNVLTSIGSTEEIFPIDDLYDVQHSTVYTKDGSCFAKQLRMDADPKTKLVSNYWFVNIAAKCP